LAADKYLLKNLFSQKDAIPQNLSGLVLKEYQDYLQSQYPDYRQRPEDLEQLAIFASSYQDLAQFLSEDHFARKI
jgi:hypothetical protein